MFPCLLHPTPSSGADVPKDFQILLWFWVWEDSETLKTWEHVLGTCLNKFTYESGWNWGFYVTMRLTLHDREILLAFYQNKDYIGAQQYTTWKESKPKHRAAVRKGWAVNECCSQASMWKCTGEKTVVWGARKLWFIHQHLLIWTFVHVTIILAKWVEDSETGVRHVAGWLTEYMCAKENKTKWKDEGNKWR